MSKDHDHKQKKELVGPWRNLHGAVWLLGMAYLFVTGNWWPGILFLIAFSMILEAVIMLVFPQSAAPEEIKPVEKTQPLEEIKPVTIEKTTPAPSYPIERLPNTCPRCGAPVRSHEVKWTSGNSADCIFCGSNLPLRK